MFFEQTLAFSCSRVVLQGEPLHYGVSSIKVNGLPLSLSLTHFDLFSMKPSGGTTTTTTRVLYERLSLWRCLASCVVLMVKRMQVRAPNEAHPRHRKYSTLARKLRELVNFFLKKLHANEPINESQQTAKQEHRGIKIISSCWANILSLPDS